MEKGSPIKNFQIPVPKLYLFSYKHLPTLPTSNRKKKEEKGIRNFLKFKEAENAFFQWQLILKGLKKIFFLGITNEMLLGKKQVNKNFFFNEKLLIFVPLHKKFFQ
jgi:hypothetical protein